MSDGIIVALIGLAATVLANIIVAKSNYDRLLNEIKRQSESADAAFDKALSVYAAQTNGKIEELTREVREHNNFARRVPILETQVAALEKKVGV